MQIFLPNNKSKLEKHYGIGNVPIGDVNLLNIFESLVVLKNICDKLNTNSASGNRQVTFSEFYIICFLLQQISNNFKALPDHYVAKEEFKEIAKIIAQGYEWRAADRLSTTHVINLSAFYNKNKDNILGYVEVEFFDNNLLQLITQYCQSLLPQGQSLDSPEIQGTINNFQIDECMTEVTKQLPLTNDKNTESNISKDDFYRLLSFNFIFLKEILANQSHQELFYSQELEARTLYIFINQVNANCLNSISKYTNDYKEYLQIQENFNPEPISRDEKKSYTEIIPIRNSTAHSTNMLYLNIAYNNIGIHYQKLQSFLNTGTNKEYYNNCIKEIKNLSISSTIKVEETKEEKPAKMAGISQKTNKTFTKATQHKAIKAEPSLNKVLDYFNTLPPPEYDHSTIDSQSITCQIMEILKDYYNSKQPINSQDVAKLKSLINHERFNANMSIICQYKTPLPTLNEYEENSSKYDNNTIVQIVQNDEKKHAGKGACFIKKRPIEVLCQIANTQDGTIELVNSILQTANYTLRNRKGFSLLEYAIINPMPEVLKVLLEKIPDNLLLEVMKGNVKGIIEEGYGQCKESHFPMFFAITLEKQEHAAILLQYDKEHYERLQVRNIITNLVTQKVRELPFNLLLIALKHKLFEFAKILLESEWEILKLNDYRGKFYKDQLEGNCPVKGAHQLSSILGVYDKLALEKLLKLCINCKVDISKVPVAVICDDGQEAKCTLFKYYFTNEKNILIKLLADNPEKLQQIASDPEVLASCNELLQKQCKEKEAIAKRL